MNMNLQSKTDIYHSVLGTDFYSNTRRNKVQEDDLSASPLAQKEEEEDEQDPQYLRLLATEENLSLVCSPSEEEEEEEVADLNFFDSSSFTRASVPVQLPWPFSFVQRRRSSRVMKQNPNPSLEAVAAAMEEQQSSTVAVMDIDDGEPLDLLSDGPLDSSKLPDADFYNSFDDDFDDSDIA